VFVQVIAHVLDIVDAAAELTFLAEIIDANEKGFPPTGTLRVLEIVASWSAMTELLGLLGWWAGCIRVALDVRVLGYSWEVWTVSENVVLVNLHVNSGTYEVRCCMIVEVAGLHSRVVEVVVSAWC
jgi:hypothetical protein